MRSIGTRPLLPLLASALLVACSDDRSEASGITVRDSAGLEIVESSSRVWAERERWTVSAEPVLEIGVLEGAPEYQFDGIVGAIPLRGGGLAVADNGSDQIRLYDEEGRHVRSMGGTGDGPGEFQSLQWIGARGDSLLAWDSQAKRLTMFTTAGDFVGSTNVRALSGFRPTAAGVLADGTLIVTPGDSPADMFAAPEGLYRGEWPYLAVSGDGSVRDTLFTLPSAERWLTKTGTGGFSASIPVFGRATHVAVAGERLVTGDSEAYEILEHAPEGSIRRLIRRAHAPVPVSDADIAAEIDRRVEASPTDPPSARERLLASLETIEPRRTLPAFADLLPDDAGNLWLRDAHPSADERQAWSVFDPSGRWLGIVEMPVDLRIRHIADDRVVATWRDELDVQYVRVHALRKP